MTIDMNDLPADVSEEITRLRSVNASSGAYIQLLEGALRAAWTAGEGLRMQLFDTAVDSLSDEDRRLREAWEVVREVVVRLPAKR